MELWDLTVKKVTEAKLPWAENTIIGLGDIQYGTQDCDVNALRRMVAWGVENDAWYIGLGDAIDVASPSNRQRIKMAALYDSPLEALDRQVDTYTEELIDILKPTVGRWLGMVRGHHYWEFEDGTTTDIRLAHALKSPFLGDCGMVDVKFERPWSNSAQRYAHLLLWIAHGQGGGSTLGGGIAPLERLSSRFEADVFIIGHHSKLVSTTYDRMYKVGKKLQSRTKVLAISGAYYRGYTVGRKRGRYPDGAYPEKKLLPPTTIGSAVLFAKPAHDPDIGDFVHVSPMLRPA